MNTEPLVLRDDEFTAVKTVAAALDPVAELRRIADQDIGGNAPWLADDLHRFADRLAAEIRGECQMRPRVVCLCGSTRFVDVFNRYRKELTEAGEIVLAVEVVTAQTREDDPQHADPGLKARLDELHKHKINLADYCLIVSDESGYFGNSTYEEIKYARTCGKPVVFVEPAAAQRALDLAITSLPLEGAAP